MHYYKNLLQPQKPPQWAFFAGGFFLLLSIVWLIKLATGDKEVAFFEWMQGFLFLLYAAILFMNGLGYTPDKLFGKAFVEITDSHIRIKSKSFGKLQQLAWNEVQALTYQNGRYLITRTDESKGKLILIGLEYAIVQEVKQAIHQVAKSKNIPVY